METNKNILVVVLAITSALVSCKQDDSGSATQASSSTNAAVTKSEDDSGSTSTAIANGSAAASIKMPVLVNGPTNAMPENQNVVVGDRLISFHKQDSIESITIWIESEKAILQYENGIIYPRTQAIYYNTNDCSGMGYYKINDNLSVAHGNRIVYWDRYYRIGRDVDKCYSRSVKEKDGSCTTLTGPMVDFRAFIAEPAAPGVTTVLSPGYYISVQ